MEKLAALPVTHLAPCAYARLLLAMLKPGAGFCRARVAACRLRQKAGLGKEVALVGMGHKFELWNAAAFEAKTDAALAMPAEALAELGALSL